MGQSGEEEKMFMRTSAGVFVAINISMTGVRPRKRDTPKRRHEARGEDDWSVTEC